MQKNANARLQPGLLDDAWNKMTHVQKYFFLAGHRGVRVNQPTTCAQMEVRFLQEVFFLDALHKVSEFCQFSGMGDRICETRWFMFFECFLNNACWRVLYKFFKKMGMCVSRSQIRQASKVALQSSPRVETCTKRYIQTIQIYFFLPYIYIYIYIYPWYTRYKI